MANYREQDWMVNVPLYLVSEWIETAEYENMTYSRSFLLMRGQIFTGKIRNMSFEYFQNNRNTHAELRGQKVIL